MLERGDLVEFILDVRLSCRRKIQQFRAGERGTVTEVVHEPAFGRLVRVHVRKSRDPLVRDDLTHLGTRFARPVSVVDRLAELAPADEGRIRRAREQRG